MNKRVNRKAVVLSAIATTVALVGIGAATLLANPSPADAGPAVNPQPVMIDQAQTPPTTQAEAEIAAYRAQLSAAYQALEQAYAQIDTLQADQSLPADASSWDDHEGEDSDHDGGDHKRDHEDSDHDHDDHDDHARDHEDDHD